MNYIRLNLCAYSYTCRECGESKVLTLDLDDVRRWKAGMHIQQAFPELSEADRELMISGICGECFESFFEEEAEDFG